MTKINKELIYRTINNRY